MPSYIVESPDGLKLNLSFDGEPPAQSVIESAFNNYRLSLQASSVRSAGPRGSSERARKLRATQGSIESQTWREAMESDPEKGLVSDQLTRMMRALGTGIPRAVQFLAREGARSAPYMPLGIGVPNPLAEQEIERRSQETPEQTEERLASNPVSQFARGVEEQSKAYYTTNPQYDTPMGNLLPSVVGSVATIAATAPLGPRAGMLAYGALQGQDEYEQARLAGATPDEMARSGYTGAVVGATTEYMLGGVAPLVSGVFRKSAKAGGKALPVLLKSVGREAAQEPLEGFLLDVGANINYDAERDPFNIKIRAIEALGGAIGGGVFGTAAAVDAYNRSKPKDKAEILARVLNQIELAVPPEAYLLPDMPEVRFADYTNTRGEVAPATVPLITEPQAGLGEAVAPEGETPIDQFRRLRALEAVPNPEKRQAQQPPVILPEQQVVPTVPIIEGAPVQLVSTPQALATGQRVLRSLRFDTPQQRAARAMLLRGSAPTPQAPSPSPIVQLPERRLRSTEPLPSRTSQQPQLRARTTPAKPSSGQRKSRKVQAQRGRQAPVETRAFAEEVEIEQTPQVAPQATPQAQQPRRLRATAPAPEPALPSEPPALLQARRQLEELRAEGKGNSDQAFRLRARIAKLEKEFKRGQSGAPRRAFGVTGSERFRRETEAIGTDILDWIVDQGGLLSKSAAIRTMGKEWWERNKSDWDDAPTSLSAPHHNVIYGGRQRPNQVAAAAFDAGKIPDAKPGTLWQAIKDASKKRKYAIARQKREAALLQQEAKQLEAWQKETGSPKEGAVLKNADDLKVGDVMEVAGERVEVTEIDPDTMTVTLEDGRKFGTQKLESGQSIWVEKFTESGEDVLADFERIAAESAAERAAAEKAERLRKFDEEYKALRAKQKARGDEAEAAAKDAEIVRLEDDAGSKIIVSKSTKQPGKWQATLFTREGEPWMDFTYDSMADAVRHLVLGDAPLKYGPIPFGGPEFKVVEARKTGPKVPEQPSSKPAVQGYRFSEADIRVGRPSTRRTKRANGDDIVTTVTIDAPLEATRPENWPHVNADHIRYEVEARGVFEERRAAKKSEPVWRVYNPKTREILAHSMTFNQAVKEAKRLMLVNNGFNPPPASTGGARLAANLPPPPPGERLVTIRRPDGTEYQASFKGLYYEHPIRGRVASIARLNDRGQWSHGMLAPGEEIVGEGDLSGQRIDPAGFSAMMRGNEGATSISPATPAEDAPRATTSDESLLSPLAGRGEVYLRPEQGADRGAVADVPNLPLPEPSDQTGAEGRQWTDDLSGRSSVAGRADGDAAWVSGQVQLLQRALERGGGKRFVLRPVAKHLIVLGPSGRRAGGTTTAGQGAAAGASTEFSEAVSRLEATFGKRVIFVESDSHLPFNGVTLPENPDVIYVNANSSKPLHAIIGHEFIEGLAFSDPQTYRELFDALAPLIRNVGKYRAWLNQMRAAHGYAPYGDIDAMREIVADFVGDRFDSPQFWDTLANRNPSLFSRVAQALRRFLARIRSALSPMGSNQYITDVQKAEEIVASALEKNASKVAKGQAQPGQAQLGQEPRFAITPQTTRGYRQLIEAPGVSPEGREALEKLSSVQSGDFDPDVKAMIVERVYTRPADAAERVARVLLRRTADLISTSESPLPLSSVTDPQQRQAAAIIRLDTHFLLQREQAKIDHAVAAAEAAMEKAVNDIPNVAVAELQRDFLNATAEAQIADFTRYLQNTAKLSPNQSLKTTAQMMLTAATQKAGGWVVSPGAIARAIQEIADNPEVFTGREVEPFAAGEMLYPSPSNEEILNRVRASGGLKGVNEEAALVLLGGMDGRGLNGVDPLLARIPNLAGLIDSLRRIKSDAAAVAREVKEFQQHFSKSGKAVGVGSAMKRYARTIAQRRTVDDYIRAKSKAYEKARAQLLGATEAQWLINNLLDGPRYRESVGLAARITGLQFDRTTEVKVGDKTKTTSPLGELDGKWMTNGPYPQGSGQFTDDKGNPVPHQFVMERDPNKESLDKSIKEAEALMKDIQQFLDDPNADPAQKESWRAVGDVVSGQWLHNITSPIEMDEYRDHPDLKHWTLFLNHLRTLDEIVSDLTGGRETYDIRQAMHGGDFLQRNLAALENDKELGHAKMVTLIVAGAKSHGFNIDGRAAVAEEYRSQILNPIAASQQHWGAIPLKVGSYIPGTAIRVTREDMEYLTTLHKFEQRVRHYSEDAIEWLYKVGSKIFEQFAGKTFTRKSAPTGPMMLTRYWNDEFVSWVRKHWDPAATADKLQEQIANVRRLIWEDKWAFDTFVRSYIFESNPDFTKRSRFADAYRKLTAKAVNEPVVVNNLRDIADAIEPFLGDTEMTREELEQAVKADIEAEVIRLLGGSQNETGVAAQLQTDLEQHGQNIIDRVVTSSLRTGGSFLDPRGKMLGPSSFYAIAKVAKSDIMLTPAVAVTISRVRTLGRLQELLKAYQREFDELNRKVNEIENSAGWWSRRQQRKHNIADINRRAELGELRFRYHVLHRRINQINAEINRAQNALTKFDEVFTPGVSRTLTALNKGITMQLLGSPGAIIRNVGGAIFVQDVVLSHMFRRQKNILFSPLGTGKMVFRVIGRRMIAAISKANPALAKRLQEFLPYSDEVMDWMQRQTEMLQRLQEGGQLPPFDYANRREAKKAAGFGGEVIRPTVEVPLHLQGAQWLFSTPPALFMQMMFPRYFDNFANEVIGHRAHQILLEVFSFAKQIGDVRTRNGKALDPTDRSQWIAPRELGITETQMTHLRKILETFGSLESLMFDYYNRMEAARKAGEPVYNVKIMRDDQMAAALLGFAKLGNVLTESNTLTIAKGGGWKSWIFTFANWPANFFNQVLKLVPPGFGPAGRKMLLPTALALTVAMAIFIGIEEFRRWAIQGMTGKVSSEPTLANVLHDPVSPEGVRYVLSAMSGGIPYLHLLLGQSSSADDLFDLSRSVPLLGFVRDTIGMGREAVRTGDVEKAFWDFSNRYLPLYATAINRMPGVSAYIESKNVARALRAATPRSIEFRPWSGGRVANPTPLTRHLRAAETAAFAGNNRLVRSALDEAIRYKMRTKGITKEQAAREIRQSISARHPEMRTYGRILAPTERQQILGRMTARQLRSYQAGQRAFETLKALANTGREIAAQQQRRRLRSTQ